MAERLTFEGAKGQAVLANDIQNTVVAAYRTVAFLRLNAKVWAIKDRYLQVRWLNEN
jgi:hypothetical protein